MRYEQNLKTTQYGEKGEETPVDLPFEEFTNTRNASRRSLLTGTFVAFVLFVIGLQFFV